MNIGVRKSIRSDIVYKIIHAKILRNKTRKTIFGRARKLQAIIRACDFRHLKLQPLLLKPTMLPQIIIYSYF